MAKEKKRGEELSAIGKQTMAHAYSAMDYYFDHLKKTVKSAPSGGTEFREKVKVYAEKNITATQEFVRDLSYARISRICFEFRWNSCGLNWRRSGSKLIVLARLNIKAASGQTSRPRP